MRRLVRSVRRRFANATSVYECRDCGTTLPEPEPSCPNCDSTEIAHYELR